jgi:hypothetical protein
MDPAQPCGRAKLCANRAQATTDWSPNENVAGPCGAAPDNTGRFPRIRRMTCQAGQGAGEPPVVPRTHPRGRFHACPGIGLDPTDAMRPLAAAEGSVASGRQQGRVARRTTSRAVRSSQTRARGNMVTQSEPREPMATILLHATFYPQAITRADGRRNTNNKPFNAVETTHYPSKRSLVSNQPCGSPPDTKSIFASLFSINARAPRQERITMRKKAPNHSDSLSPETPATTSWAP